MTFVPFPPTEGEYDAYAGIGSQKTPDDIMDLMTRVARVLSSRGYTLRSGHADGADSAFELGAGLRSEIYIPWRRFNGSVTGIIATDLPNYREALAIAQDHHPAWHNCREGARKLHARNVYQVLGRDLSTPVRGVICWTSNGRDKGGTGQAIRIATSLKIPIYNLHNPEILADFSVLAGNLL